MSSNIRPGASIGVVGAGISGVSFARLISEKGCRPTIYEKNSRPGGLIQCDLVEDHLFHKVGGHVFNSKNEKVLQWFWNYFDKSNEFIPAVRNAAIFLDNKFIGYPIEFNLDQLDSRVLADIRAELLELLNVERTSSADYSNFYDFLQYNFGKTLCDLYFIPYNHKIWKADLTQVPLDWLQGKLPMTSPSQILLNLEHVNQTDSMVHSTFFYPLSGGSQFIIDRLSLNLDIVHATIDSIAFSNGRIILNKNNELSHELLVYTGDIRDLVSLFSAQDLEELGIDTVDIANLNDLPSNSTSTMLCECDVNPYSWIYIPSPTFKIHRVIMTGNFSKNNSSQSIDPRRTTCTIEYSGFLSSDEMRIEAKKLPYNMIPISYNFCQDSYVIHSPLTASIIHGVREKLRKKGIYCLGRFAEWQYYNMDAAIESAMHLVDKLAQP
jgi:protoporphyrinogen oxidase